MKRLFNKARKNKLGSAIVMTVGFALIYTIAIGATLSFVQNQTRMTHRARVSMNSLDGARATLDALSNNILHIVKQRPARQLNGKFTELHNVISSVQPSEQQGMSLVKDAADNTLTYILDRAPADKEFREITDPNHDWYGYSIMELDYELVSAVVEDSNRKDLLGYEGSALRQRVTLRYIPLYQFAIFYEGDLEFHPGPTMDVRGPVHSNTDLFLAAVNRIRFHSKVTTAGNLYRYHAINQDGDVEIKVPNGSGGHNWVNMQNPPTPNNGDDYLDHLDEDIWFSAALDRWKGQVLDSAHGINPIRPPLPTGADMSDLINRINPSDSDDLKASKFESLADLIISGDPGNPATIKAHLHTIDDNGDRQFQQLPQSFVDDVIDIGEFYDGHAMTVVRTLDLNMAALVQNYGDTFAEIDPGDFTRKNGVIYISTKPGEDNSFTLAPNNQDPVYEKDANGKIVFDTDEGDGHPVYLSDGWHTGGSTVTEMRTNYMPAVRIINGELIPQTDDRSLAIYTDRPIYVADDFNTVDHPEYGDIATSVIGGDAATVTSVRQRLATLDTSPSGTAGVGWPDATDGLVDTLSAAGERIYRGWTYIEADPPGSEYWFNGNDWTDNDFYWPYNERDDDVWRDSDNNTRDIEDKTETENTVTNTIFLMGYTPTIYNSSYERGLQPGLNGYGSGGSHNVMRYLEDWRSTHTLSGSIIVLFDSQVAAQKWRCCNDDDYYRPPTRDYGWDNRLQAAVPPKGMPYFIEPKKWEMEPISLEYAIANHPGNQTGD